MKILINPKIMTFTTTVPDIEPSEGIQKIAGFTRGLSFHRVKYKPYWHISNSIVLGCNRSENEDTVRLWAYGYVGGEHFQELLCKKKVGDKLSVDMQWNKWLCLVALYDKFDSHRCFKNTGFHTLPIGYLLRNYAEIDNTNNKTKFHWPVEDLRVNGREIK